MFVNFVSVYLPAHQLQPIRLGYTALEAFASSSGKQKGIHGPIRDTSVSKPTEDRASKQYYLNFGVATAK